MFVLTIWEHNHNIFGHWMSKPNDHRCNVCSHSWSRTISRDSFRPPHWKTYGCDKDPWKWCVTTSELAVVAQSAVANKHVGHTHVRSSYTDGLKCNLVTSSRPVHPSVHHSNVKFWSAVSLISIGIPFVHYSPHRCTDYGVNVQYFTVVLIMW